MTDPEKHFMIVTAPDGFTSAALDATSLRFTTTMVSDRVHTAKQWETATKISSTLSVTSPNVQWLYDQEYLWDGGVPRVKVFRGATLVALGELPEYDPDDQYQNDVVVLNGVPVEAGDPGNAEVVGYVIDTGTRFTANAGRLTAQDSVLFVEGLREESIGLTRGFAVVVHFGGRVWTADIAEFDGSTAAFALDREYTRG